MTVMVVAGVVVLVWCLDVIECARVFCSGVEVKISWKGHFMGEAISKFQQVRGPQRSQRSAAELHPIGGSSE